MRTMMLALGALFVVDVVLVCTGHLMGVVVGLELVRMGSGDWHLEVLLMLYRPGVKTHLVPAEQQRAVAPAPQHFDGDGHILFVLLQHVCHWGW